MDDAPDTASALAGENGGSIPLGHTRPSATSVILDITREIFPGDATLSTDRDPSYPGYEWQVVNVACPDDVQGILAKEAQWHERTYAALGSEAARFSLCVYPVTS